MNPKAREPRSIGLAMLLCTAADSFCRRWLQLGSAARSAMSEATRDCRRSAAGWSRAALTSHDAEISVLNALRAGLSKLILAYEEFLRQSEQQPWTDEHPEALALRVMVQRMNLPERGAPIDPTDRFNPFGPYRRWLGSRDPSIAANGAICVARHASSMVERQISAAESNRAGSGGPRSER